MKDCWINIGQVEELRPDTEPPWSDVDPQVAQVMKTMGYEQHEYGTYSQEKTYNNIMGTYLTLDIMKTKICGLKIRVRPCPSSDPNISLSPTQGVLGIRAEILRLHHPA